MVDCLDPSRMSGLGSRCYLSQGEGRSALHHPLVLFAIEFIDCVQDRADRMIVFIVIPIVVNEFVEDARVRDYDFANRREGNSTFDDARIKMERLTQVNPHRTSGHAVEEVVEAVSSIRLLACYEVGGVGNHDRPLVLSDNGIRRRALVCPGQQTVEGALIIDAPLFVVGKDGSANGEPFIF